MSVQAPSLQAGHLARGPFALAAIGVYFASFVSQILLSAPVTARMSVAPFVVVQAVLIWLWIVLHWRRLRDAGRPAGIVIGIALVYALTAVLLALIICILTSPGAQSGDPDNPASIFHLFAILYLIGMMAGQSQLAGLQAWLIVFAFVMFLPVVIAMIFSLWAATRPSAPAVP
jgi:hypothetical protein